MTSLLTLLDWPALGASVGNHLWQTTLFVGLVWLLTIVLKKNRASVRHWLWLAGSVKFLLPVSLLVSFGSRLEWLPHSSVKQPSFTIIENIGQPFPEPVI
jgi:bla regulator protein BlaR1